MPVNNWAWNNPAVQSIYGSSGGGPSEPGNPISFEELSPVSSEIMSWNEALGTFTPNGPVPSAPTPESMHEYMKKSTAKHYYRSALFGDSPKEARSASQLSDEYQALTKQITELRGSIHQETEELERVLVNIATQVEVVRDIGTIVHSRIAILQQAANQLETWRRSLTPPSLPDSERGLAVDRSPPAEAGPPVAAGVTQVAPGLFVQDLG